MKKDTIYPKRGEMLGNWLTRQTSSKATDTGNNALNFWIAPTLVSQGGFDKYVESEQCKGRHHPRDKTEGSGSSTWSVLNRSKSRARKNDALDANTVSENVPRPATAPNQGLTHASLGISKSPKKREEAFPKRRKLSVPGLMTTVQEGSLDSPTIPGQHSLKPGFERSNSVPGIKLRWISAERKEQMLHESTNAMPSSKNKSEAPQTTDRAEDAVRGVATRNLLDELTPLVIPPSTHLQEIIDIRTTFNPENVDDAPPQVPPKSPRTESRASPRSRKLPHSASSSTSTTHSVTSPSSALARAAGRLYMAQDSNNSLSLPQTPSAENTTASTAPWGQVSHEKRHTSHQKNEYPLPARSTSMKRPPQAVKAQLWYQRGISKPSVIDRERPMKRGDTSLIPSLSKPMLRSPSLGKECLDISSGFKATEAPCRVPDAESRYLKKQANEQVEAFKVLPINQVSELTKELKFLDERCEILQNTHSSLRQGRRTLHTRIITYLKSPRMSIFSHDSILKQEEALAELDKSIDDWVMKLEQARNRRAQIRQRLLEHIAAALTLTTTGRPESHEVIDDHRSSMTPPRLEEICRSERHDVQSIKVYADPGVAALLAETEQEIGTTKDTSKAMKC